MNADGAVEIVRDHAGAEQHVAISRGACAGGDRAA